MIDFISKNYSAILLAGGKSTRMGTNKAMLLWRGQTLLSYQVSKIKELGIQDILVAGNTFSLKGTRQISDIIPGKGPLSGLHAGLTEAKNKFCLVLCIDTPLVTKDDLLSLIVYHSSNAHEITIFGHGSKIEPLIGVYNRTVAKRAEIILHTDTTSVRRLLDDSDVALLDNEKFKWHFIDCNTPMEYQKAKEIFFSKEINSK